MNDLQKLIDKVIDKAVVGCDTYKHNGSTWLLFTDDKKWVIELTKEGTLWYNYYFFQKLFKVIALDVVENQHYITKWVEDTVINGVKSTEPIKNLSIVSVEDTIGNGVKYTIDIEDTIENGVKHTIDTTHHKNKYVEDTIQNGVKHTRKLQFVSPSHVEDTIQNGVKHTIPQNNKSHEYVEHTIQNGVKETKGEYYKEIQKVEYTIQNGVKVIHPSVPRNCIEVEDAIQNGVKHTSNRRLVVSKDIEDTIQNGVKRTLQKNINRIGQVEDAIKNGVKRTIADDIRMGWPIIEDTIQNGVKETHRDAERHPKTVEDAIQNGVRHTLQRRHPKRWHVEDTIQNGVKDTQYWIFENHPGVEDTIQNGVKHTDFNIYIANNRVEDTIQNGVKVTYSDKIPHEYDWSNQFTEEIDDIIQNGVKHTEKSLQIDGSCVIEDVIKEGVIEHGIKETKSEVATREWKAGEVINGGVKKTTPGGYLGSVEMKGKMVHQFEHSKQDDNVEDVIKSGIKATTTNLPLSQDDGQIAEIEDVIKNGIKKTEAAALFDEELKMDTVISNGIKETIPVVPGDILDTIDFMSYNNTTNVQHLISDVIENGIKETHDDVMPHTGRVEGVIKNGVKECIPSRTPLYNPMDFSVQYRENHRLDDVASVLEKGIKEVQPLPSQEGNMDYSNYYYRQGDRTKPHTQYVNDVITNGIKKTEAAAFRIVDGVISNGKIIK
jgi:hypothetical protein